VTAYSISGTTAYASFTPGSRPGDRGQVSDIITEAYAGDTVYICADMSGDITSVPEVTFVDTGFMAPQDYQRIYYFEMPESNITITDSDPR